MTPDVARSTILDAAARMFARYGIEKTTIDDIAEQAGVSRSMIYRHFGSRDEILTGVVGRMTDDFVDHLAGRLGSSDTLAEFIEDAMVEVVTLVRSDTSIVAYFSDGGRAAIGRVVGTSDEIKTRARRFAHRILDRAGPERAAELRPGIDIDAAADHLVLVGLALIQGFGPVSDDPERLRNYLATFVVPTLVDNTNRGTP